MSESPEEIERQKRLQAIAARTESMNARGMSKQGWQAKGKKECKPKTTPTRPVESSGSIEEDDERKKRLQAFEARNAATTNRGMAGKRTTPAPDQTAATSPPPSSPSSPQCDNKSDADPTIEDERQKRLRAMEQRAVNEKNRGMSKAGWKGKTESTAELKEKQQQKPQQKVEEKQAPTPSSPATAESSEAEELRRLRLQNMEQRNAPKVFKKPKVEPPTKTAETTPQKPIHSDPSPSSPVEPTPKKERDPPPELSKSAQAALDRQLKAPAGISKEAAEELAIRREKNDLLGSIEALCKLNGVTMPFALPSCSIEKLREFKQSLIK